METTIDEAAKPTTDAQPAPKGKAAQVVEPACKANAAKKA